MNIQDRATEAFAARPSFVARLWGDFSITDANGTDLTPRSRKSRALIAWLACHPGRPISRERLCGLLWGDRGEEQARASLRQTLFELKAFTTGPSPLLRADRQTIALDPARLRTDMDALREAATTADREQLARLLPDHDETFLGNLDGIDSGFDDWLLIERTRQRDQLDALIATGMAASQTPSAAFVAAPIPAPEHQDHSPAPSPAAPTARRLARLSVLLLAAALVAAIGVFAWRQFVPPAQPAPLAIAVLPFEDLSGNDRPYLAEGVSEEILNRLAGNPGLKVLGRTSAAALKGQPLAAPEIGRRLDVDYLVEGSVRASGQDLRVVVALVRSEDGARLWSRQFDGTLADLFAIQDAIGESVASCLNLPAGARPEGMLNAEAETYARYLQARTMLRGLSPDLIDPGIAILRQVLATNPRFAPAWAELGWGYGAKAYFSPPGPGKAAAIQEALAAANRALAIDPKLARAHLILGTNGASRPDARQHLETATRLDPGSAENWYFLHEAHFFEGDYPRTLDVLRRAVAIDPLWWPAFFQASNFAWEMGYREEAEAYVRRVEEAASPPSEAHMVRSDMANRRGDYSGAIAESEKAWLSAPPDRRFFAELSFGGALRSAGRYDEAARNWLRYPVDPVMLGMWKGKAPDPGTTRILIGDAATTWAIEDRIHFLLTTLQAAGRGADIARLFAARYPSPEAMARDMGPNTKFIERAVPVAFGLRAAGRAAEADRLLALASDAAAAIAARGPVPLEHLKVEAGLLATTGRRDEAIAALERAHARGFHYNRYYHSFPDMAQEPAFAPIRDDPRFQRIRRANLAHSAREAREIAAIAVDPRLAARFAARPTPN